MHFKALLPVLGALILLGGCSPASQTRVHRTGVGASPFKDYVNNGDPAVRLGQQSLGQAKPDEPNQAPKEAKMPPEATEAEASPTALVPAATPEEPKTLAGRLREFEISRFAVKAENPSRFGGERFELKIFFRDRAAAQFQGPLESKNKGQFDLKAENEHYSLFGELNDSPDKTLGLLQLTDKRTQEKVEISYRAYRAKLTVHPDRDKSLQQGSVYDRQLKSLGYDANAKDPQVKAFGWVNNWNVVDGPSFYLVDIVRQLSAAKAEEKDTDQEPFALSFRGESKATSGDSETFEHPAELTGGQSGSSVLLIGNPEEGNRRMFQVTMEDKGTKEKNDLIIDIEMENPEEEEEELAENEKPIEYEVKGEVSALDSQFLVSDLSLPRSRRMIEDLNRNEQLRGVRREIGRFQRARRSEMENFFHYAHPFKPILETIGRSFDVSPSFAYVTVVESPYFTGGKYQIVRPPVVMKGKKGKGKRESSALGPFQILVGTAENNGMVVVRGKDSPEDERNYFAPSACAAARYFIKLTDLFWKGDTTFAILGYYQGETGAAAAIGCGVGNEKATDQKQCAARVHPKHPEHLSEKELLRYQEISRRFNKTYADVESMGYLPKGFRNYVNRKLAAYFIAKNRARYGFPIKPGKTELPDNGTVVPPFPIHDQFCRETTAKALSI